jgi:tight adherence protein B
LLAGLAAAVLAYMIVGAALGVRPQILPSTRTRRSRAERRREWLHQAGTGVAPAQFVLASLLGGAGAGLVVLLVARVLPLALLAGGVTSLWPRAYYARRRRRITAERMAAWPDALRDLIAHLRAPLSVHAALLELGRTGPLPLRPSFARYGALSSALDHRRALEVVREELADPLSDRILEIILVAFDQGSAVVIDILADLATATGADLRLHEEIETAQLETRLEAWGAAVLPFAVLALLCATSRDYRAFYAAPAGWLVIVVGGAMSVAGLLAINRLGRIPSEERILAGGGPT